MSHLTKRFILVGFILLFATAACSLPVRPDPGNSETDQRTQAAQTLAAIMTQAANQSTPAATVVAGATSQATAQNPTVAPSATLAPTSTDSVQQTATQVPPTATATSRPQVCDQAGFVADITVPDGSVLAAGTPFTKTWRLKNIGTCTWTTDYHLVFDSGNGMNGPTSQRLPGSVAPGQTIDISVNLKAPGEPGQFTGYWKLRNAANAVFGLGPQNSAFYVEIKVTAASPSASGYDFAGNYCLAQWTGGSTNLACNGKDGASEGFVLFKNRPILENGYVDDEPALITNPPRVNDGVIRGKYPVYTVQSGDHFKAIVGCEHNARNCNVKFQLDYQIDNGSIQTLATWHEAYEGMYSIVDVDLSSLAGKNVNFILTVMSNGASDNDRALWLLPRIEKVVPTATPTATYVPTSTMTPTPTETTTSMPTQIPTVVENTVP